MRGNGRYQLALGLALVASLAFLAFLLAASAASWAVGQATWVWFEHLASASCPLQARRSSMPEALEPWLA